MKAFIALGALAAVLALPSASAVISTADQFEAIAMFVDIIAPGAADFSALPTLYMDAAGNFWQETNGLAGLQTAETPVEGGDPIPADTILAGPGAIALPL